MLVEASNESTEVLKSEPWKTGKKSLHLNACHIQRPKRRRSDFTSQAVKPLPPATPSTNLESRAGERAVGIVCINRFLKSIFKGRIVSSTIFM